jgi:hypothetical protein
VTAIFKGTTSSNVYAGDAKSKRLITTAGSESIQDQIQQFLLAGMATANGSSPWVLPQSTVNEIPTIV